MSTYVTTAIPLRIMPFTRDDELVVLYTRTHGKVYAVVRGGQKIASKLSQRFHVIQELDVMLAPGKQRVIVAGVQTRRQLPGLQQDTTRRLLALTLLDVINHVTPEGDTDSSIYDYTSFWLSVIEHESTERLHGSYGALLVWRLLTKIGLRPDASQVKHDILHMVLEAPDETTVATLLRTIDFNNQILAGREALPIIEALLERELRGLRVMRDSLM